MAPERVVTRMRIFGPVNGRDYIPVLWVWPSAVPGRNQSPVNGFWFWVATAIFLLLITAVAPTDSPSDGPQTSQTPDKSRNRTFPREFPVCAFDCGKLQLRTFGLWPLVYVEDNLHDIRRGNSFVGELYRCGWVSMRGEQILDDGCGPRHSCLIEVGFH